MTENKQIEEMALVMCGRESCMTCTHFVNATKCAAIVSAKKLYNAGYRKVESGEWISHGINMTGTVGNWKCSACNKTSLSPSDFCGRCGADMRRESEK